MGDETFGGYTEMALFMCVEDVAKHDLKPSVDLVMALHEWGTRCYEAKRCPEAEDFKRLVARAESTERLLASLNTSNQALEARAERAEAELAQIARVTEGGLLRLDQVRLLQRDSDRLAAENAGLRARLAEVERVRDAALDASMIVAEFGLGCIVSADGKVHSLPDGLVVLIDGVPHLPAIEECDECGGRGVVSDRMPMPSPEPCGKCIPDSAGFPSGRMWVAVPYEGGN
jgi:hypothetical protein